MKDRRSFTPQPGAGYWNQGGGVYDCISVQGERIAVMQNRKSGWTFTAHGIGMYADGSIDWDYSTGGRFINDAGQQDTDADRTKEILTAAVDTWGKAAQVDMMIEEMAELSKELLNERRGRDNHIAEEMADVRIMLQQMEIIFQNAADVERIFREKVVRIDQRLQSRKGAAV